MANTGTDQTRSPEEQWIINRLGYDIFKRLKADRQTLQDLNALPARLDRQAETARQRGGETGNLQLPRDNIPHKITETEDKIQSEEHIYAELDAEYRHGNNGKRVQISEIDFVLFEYYEGNHKLIEGGKLTVSIVKGSPEFRETKLDINGSGKAQLHGPFFFDLVGKLSILAHVTDQETHKQRSISGEYDWRLKPGDTTLTISGREKGRIQAHEHSTSQTSKSQHADARSMDGKGQSGLTYKHTSDAGGSVSGTLPKQLGKAELHGGGKGELNLGTGATVSGGSKHSDAGSTDTTETDRTINQENRPGGEFEFQ